MNTLKGKVAGFAPILLLAGCVLGWSSSEAQQFKANRSLRDVEPTVNLWVRSPSGAMVEEEGE